MRLRSLLALFTLAACGGKAPVASDVPPTFPDVTTQPCTSLGLSARRAAVSIPERGTRTPLDGAVFAPADASGALPIVSILPGGGAQISSVEWAACALAARGYVVAITKPASGVSADSYHLAAVSGIDFLASAANPFRAAADTGRVGVAGWSLGARTLSRTQAEDARVDALAAWDNLALSEAGDAGSPACTNVPGTLRTPRVPALGQASDSCTDKPADAKKTAYAAWKAAGVPAVQVVFAGSNHFLWSAAAPEAQHAVSHHYTLAWFDRWLKGDATATARLLSRTVNGSGVDAVLSTRFRSAAYIDGRDCEDLRTAC